MGFPPHGPEPCASTNSATSAMGCGGSDWTAALNSSEGAWSCQQRVERACCVVYGHTEINQTLKKKHFTKDPHAAREAARYETPIPSREYLLEFLDDYGLPITERRLAEALDIDEESQEGLRRRLGAMVRDGQLVRNRRAGFLPVNRRELIKGRVIGRDRN